MFSRERVECGAAEETQHSFAHRHHGGRSREEREDPLGAGASYRLIRASRLQSDNSRRRGRRREQHLIGGRRSVARLPGKPPAGSGRVVCLSSWEPLVGSMLYHAQLSHAAGDCQHCQAAGTRAELHPIIGQQRLFEIGGGLQAWSRLRNQMR